jgi:Tfp pilus assembly protein PilO
MNSLQQLAKQLAKLKAYPLAISLLLAAMLAAGWTAYRQGDMDQADSDYKTASDQNDVVTNNLVAGRSLDAHLNELGEDKKIIDAALINPAESVANQQYFFSFESTGVSIIDPIQGMPILSKDSAEPSVTPFTLSAIGQWDNMVSFVYGLQTGSHLLRFNSFRLEKSQQTLSIGSAPDRLVLTLSLEVLGK